jgi:hypothetical protein
MGKIVLELWTEDNHKVSDMTVDNFDLAAGPNKVTQFNGIKATYDVAAAGQAGRKFLSTYAVGENQTVYIRGASDGSGTNIALLKPALAALTSTSMCPGMPYPKNRLLVSSEMHVPSLLSLTKIPTQLQVQNPFSVPVTFKTARCDVTACKEYAAKGCKPDGYWDKPIGYYTPDTIDEVVKGGDTKWLNKHTVQSYGLFNPATIQTLFKSLQKKGSTIMLNGSMTLAVGENTEVTVDYHERDVPVHLSLTGEEAEAVV